MTMKAPLPKTLLRLLFLTIILLAVHSRPDNRDKDSVPYQLHYSSLLSSKELQSQSPNEQGLRRWEAKGPRRWMIGSTAPTCTYECRGCRFKCTAEQVPVDANDPINSAYRYRCVCRR